MKKIKRKFKDIKFFLKDFFDKTLDAELNIFKSNRKLSIFDIKKNNLLDFSHKKKFIT